MRWIPRDRVAAYYPFLTKATLASLAHRRRGPAYRIIGRKAVYAEAELEAYVASLPVYGTPYAPTMPEGAPSNFRKSGRRGRPRKQGIN
jgi:hypothetical protein